MWRSHIGACVVAALLVVGLSGFASGSGRAPAPCGWTAAPPPRTYDHVILVVMENHSFDRIAGASPFLNGLAARCALATGDSAITHPSLPNYLAMTSGSIDGIRGDCLRCVTGARSLFEQLGASGWRSYLESMPADGYLGADSGLYPKEHNPASYYSRIRTAYMSDALSLGMLDAGPLVDDLSSGALRRFSLIVPNTCDSEEDCSVEVGDAWLSRWISAILASPVYRHGRTALFITYDEGRRKNQRVYTVAVSPFVRPGAIVATPFNHYSLLKTIESTLGVPCIAHACDPSVSSMRQALHL